MKWAIKMYIYFFSTYCIQCSLNKNVTSQCSRLKASVQINWLFGGEFPGLNSSGSLVCGGQVNVAIHSRGYTTAVASNQWCSCDNK